MILTLVGLSEGLLGDVATRSRGTGADIMVRPPGSSIIGFSGSNMPQGVVNLVRQQPHVTLATGSLVQGIGNFNSIEGIHLNEFNEMSGGFRYLEGGPFTGPNDLIVDDVYARSVNIHAGDTIDLGLKFHVSGIVESGKMSRMFAQLEPVQKRYSQTDKVSIIWVKIDDPANTQIVIDELKNALLDYQVWSVDQYVSLISANNIPLLRQFTGVVIGLGVVIGFLVVFLSMYTVVLERTREIGILKALGASPAYVLGILLRETILLAVVGSIAGILMTYGVRSLMHIFAPTFTTVIVHSWWPYATLIAVVGALIGALYPGFKAARQDAIEALAYD